jgi:hypothetical protein
VRGLARFFERSGVARVCAALAHRNRHLALAVWLLTFVPLAGAVAAHGYDRPHWRHWANLVFYGAAACAFVVAWLGEQAKAAR